MLVLTAGTGVRYFGTHSSEVNCEDEFEYDFGIHHHRRDHQQAVNI